MKRRSERVIGFVTISVSVMMLTAVWALIVERTAANSPGIGKGPFSDPSERTSSSAIPLAAERNR